MSREGYPRACYRLPEPFRPGRPVGRGAYSLPVGRSPRQTRLRWEAVPVNGSDSVVLSKDRCALCGESRPLTFEHLPPRSTGNTGPGISFSADHYLHRLGGGPEPLLGSGFDDGSGKVALCHECNGNTARWYM